MSILDRCVVFACDFKPRVVNGLAVMPNHGRAGGAPTWLQLGDGSTASTIPTPKAGFGCDFRGGGPYIKTGVVDRYDRGASFSLYVRCKNNLGYAISTFDSVTSSGISLVWQSTRVDFQLIGGGTELRAATSTRPLETMSLAAVYNGALSALIYKNGAIASTIAASSLASSIKNGKEFVLGSRSNTIGIEMRGTADSFAIIDGTITPADIYELDTLTKAGIR